MDRRNFLRAAAMTIGGIALDQAIPFGRIWSFPKVIKPANYIRQTTHYMIADDILRRRAGLIWPNNLLKVEFDYRRMMADVYIDKGDGKKSCLLSYPIGRLQSQTL
jgi:hypothetical protein